MHWSRLLRALVDAAVSEEIPHVIQKEVRVNRAIAVNDESDATTAASAVQDSPVTQTRRQ
ncbi:MAG TPA: hypothetical protein VFH50_10890 [Acidimicrobiales bacterium]|nr:hypothetical protein [Acidimicrobiales bacterium]